jgi:hypothetical protein
MGPDKMGEIHTAPPRMDNDCDSIRSRCAILNSNNEKETGENLRHASQGRRGCQVSGFPIARIHGEPTGNARSVSLKSRIWDEIKKGPGEKPGLLAYGVGLLFFALVLEIVESDVVFANHFCNFPIGFEL